MAECEPSLVGEFSAVIGLLQQGDVHRDAGPSHIVGIARRHQRLDVVPNRRALRMSS